MKTEQFAFDISVAVRYGVHEAIFVAGLEKLIQENRERCVWEDGLWWYPCAIYEWEGAFPFWSARQVDRIVKNCVLKHLVFQRHYDGDERRRRGWYAVQKNEADYD